MPERIITRDTEVELIATPNTGYKFTEWTDGDKNIIRRAKVGYIVDLESKLTAKFQKKESIPDPDHGSDVDPDNPQTKYSIACLTYDIDIENSIEGNGWSDTPGTTADSAHSLECKSEVDIDEEFTLTPHVAEGRETHSGFIIIKDLNYIPKDTIKSNYKGYIAYRFGGSGIKTSLATLIDSAKSYNPKNWISPLPLPIYTIAKSSPISQNKTNRIYKTARARHNTWFYTFGSNTDWVNRRLYFSDESWTKVKSIIDETGSDIVCMLILGIKHDVNDQGFKKVYTNTPIRTDESGVRIAGVDSTTDVTDEYRGQYVINRSACPLNNPEYLTLNKVNSVNFSLAGGDIKTFDEKYILYQVPDEGAYKGKWVAISTDDKQGDAWSEEFTRMREAIPSLWFVNLSDDGIIFLWTVTQNPQLFALDVVPKEVTPDTDPDSPITPTSPQLTINYADDGDGGVLDINIEPDSSDPSTDPEPGPGQDSHTSPQLTINYADDGNGGVLDIESGPESLITTTSPQLTINYADDGDGGVLVRDNKNE